MEFKDKEVDNKYSELLARANDLADEIDEVNEQIQWLIENEEQV